MKSTPKFRARWKALAAMFAPAMAALALAAGAAQAADPAVTCESSKLGTSAKYAQCRLKAEAKAVKGGDPVDYSKCTLAKFGDAETKAGMGTCPSEGDQTAIGDFVNACTDSVAVALGGGALPIDVVTCNNAVGTCVGDLDVCTTDLTLCDSSLAACQAAPLLPATGQVTCSNGAGTVVACAGTGQDGDVLAGVARSFTDNGDGTITDDATGLQWEKLGDDGSIHDKDNQYFWSNAFAVKIAQLNTDNFAGHNDWRVPNYYELLTLVNAEDPPTFAEFDNGCTGGCSPTTCSCTVGDNYLTSTTSEGTTRSQVYTVRFTTGLGVIVGKGTTYPMRAVRGGGSDPGNCTAGELTARDADIVAINADAAACETDLAACATNCDVSIAGLPATGQTTSYGPGSDGSLEQGLARSFTDNGDGTITDMGTGLMWEKKSDDGTVHDKDNAYAWGMTSPPYTMDGTMVTAFLDTLNNRCSNDELVACTVDADCAVPGGPCGFAGHRDWRIPNQYELHALVNFEVPYPGPTVFPEFNDACMGGCTVTTCSCTQSSNHWSSTTYRNAPDFAWIVYFGNGGTDADGKTDYNYVRAVRAGS